MSAATALLTLVVEKESSNPAATSRPPTFTREDPGVYTPTGTQVYPITREGCFLPTSSAHQEACQCHILDAVVLQDEGQVGGGEPTQARFALHNLSECVDTCGGAREAAACVRETEGERDRESETLTQCGQAVNKRSAGSPTWLSASKGPAIHICLGDKL